MAVKEKLHNWVDQLDDTQAQEILALVESRSSIIFSAP